MIVAIARTILAGILALVPLVAFPAACTMLAGCGSGYLAFHLVGVPTGAQCGLAALPALFVGAVAAILGGFIGFTGGLAIGGALADLIFCLVAGIDIKDD